MRRRLSGGGWFRDFRLLVGFIGFCGLWFLPISPEPLFAQSPSDQPAHSQRLMIEPPASNPSLLSHGQGSGGWWTGGASIVVALAAFGGLTYVAKRWGIGSVGETDFLRVVGKTSLSPRHTVFVVKAQDRTLLIGIGPQGPPALLGELFATETGGES